MKAYERLLSYVKVFTPSSEETGTSPSTQYQFDLARLLVQELKELGVKDFSSEKSVLKNPDSGYVENQTKSTGTILL